MGHAIIYCYFSKNNQHSIVHWPSPSGNERNLIKRYTIDIEESIKRQQFVRKTCSLADNGVYLCEESTAQKY